MRLDVERRRVTETEYTYTARKVANSTTAFEEFVRSAVITNRLERDRLSERQRTIIEMARTDEYGERGSLSDAFRALLERLGNGAVPDSTTTKYVRYGEEYYKVNVHVTSS